MPSLEFGPWHSREYSIYDVVKGAGRSCAWRFPWIHTVLCVLSPSEWTLRRATVCQAESCTSLMPPSRGIAAHSQQSPHCVSGRDLAARWTFWTERKTGGGCEKGNPRLWRALLYFVPAFASIAFPPVLSIRQRLREQVSISRLLSAFSGQGIFLNMSCPRVLISQPFNAFNLSSPLSTPS